MNFSKSLKYTRRSGWCNFCSSKNSFVQINSKLNSKLYDNSTYILILLCFLRRPFYILTIDSTFERLLPDDQVQSKSFLFAQAICTSQYGGCRFVATPHLRLKPQFTNHLFTFFYPSENVNNLKETYQTCISNTGFL